MCVARVLSVHDLSSNMTFTCTNANPQTRILCIMRIRDMYVRTYIYMRIYDQMQVHTHVRKELSRPAVDEIIIDKIATTSLRNVVALLPSALQKLAKKGT